MPSPTPRDVIEAALAVNLPCPLCGATTPCRCLRPEGYSPLNARAALIEAALTQQGMLADGKAEPTQADIDEAAMMLAAKSRHPRYISSTDGWRKILQSVSDVEVAYRQAAANVPATQQQPLNDLRTLLVAWHNRRAAQDVT